MNNGNYQINDSKKITKPIQYYKDYWYGKPSLRGQDHLKQSYDNNYFEILRSSRLLVFKYKTEGGQISGGTSQFTSMIVHYKNLFIFG